MDFNRHHANEPATRILSQHDRLFLLRKLKLVLEHEKLVLEHEIFRPDTGTQFPRIKYPMSYWGPYQAI